MYGCVFIYEEDLAWNNPFGLRSHKTQPNQIRRSNEIKLKRIKILNWYLDELWIINYYVEFIWNWGGIIKEQNSLDANTFYHSKLSLLNFPYSTKLGKKE